MSLDARASQQGHTLLQKGQRMTTAIETRTDWVALAQQLGTEFAPRAAAHDADDSFVAENFDILKQHNIFAAGIPGGGWGLQG